MSDVPVFNAGPEPKLWRALAIAAAFSLSLVLLALVFSYEYNRSSANSVNVNRAYRERLEIDELLTTLQDAETGQRGYIVTGNPAFLAPYLSARDRIEIRVMSLNNVFLGSPRQQQRLARLRGLISAKFDEMRRVMAIRDAQGLNAAASAIASGEGKRMMDAIRAIHADMVDEKNRSLGDAVRQQRARVIATKRVIWGLVASIALGAFLIGYLFWRARRRNHFLVLKAVEYGTRQNAIFDAAQDAIVLVNASGSIEVLNTAAERLFGYAADQLLRRDISLLVEIAPGRGPFLDRLGYGPGGLSSPFRSQLQATRRDGSVLPVEASLGAMVLADGVHIVIAFRDVSERERAEELKDQFLSTVSHELRTPLTSIVGSLGLLRGGAVAELTPEVQRLVVIAENNAIRLIRLVNDLLDIEKLEAGTMSFDFQPFDLREMIAQAADTMRGLADRRGVVLDADAGDTPVIVRGDSERLVQVVSNLLSNAVRFSPSGGAVTLTVEPEPNRVIFSVRDLGPGIDPELDRKLFTRFAQGPRPAGESAGTGLGLTISREIVRAHGGRIWHAQTSEPGALFCVELPLWSLSAPDAPGEARSILICAAPDDADAIRIAARAQTICGDAVPDLASAHDAASRRQYSALVMDCQRQGTNDPAALAVMRVDPRTRHLAVIGLHTDAQPPAGWADAGLAGWLRMPVEPAALSKAIDAAIRHSADRLPLVLHVDDDSDTRDLVARALAGWARVIPAADIAAARSFLASRTPRLIVLDHALPDGSGRDLIAELAGAGDRAIPIIVFSAQHGGDDLAGPVAAVITKDDGSLPGLLAAIGTILDRRSQQAGR